MAAGAELERARKLAEAANDLYSQLKRACEQQAVRWEWGTFVLHSLDPAYFEIHKVRRGEPLDGEPDEPISGVHGYGFDAAGRLVVERQLTEFPGRYYETFYQWEPDGTARLYFGYDPTKRWINAAWLSHDDAGRVRSIDTVYARGNAISETYQYDRDGRVVGMERRGANPPYGDIHEFRDLEYDAAGRIVRIYWRDPDGRRVLDFERPSDGQTLTALRKAISDGFVHAVITSLDRLSINEPVFALAIHYCGAEYQHRLPPNVAVGLEAERARFLESHGKEAPGLIWNPAEWRTHIELELDAELSARCESASQDIWQNDLQEEADAFMASLAQQLSQQRLPIPRTNDFVAYAVNLDNGAFAEDVSSQISPQLATQFRQRGVM